MARAKWSIRSPCWKPRRPTPGMNPAVAMLASAGRGGGGEIAIRGEAGEPVAAGDSGEVMIRAQHLMMGYRTADGFAPLAPDEFHDTGDLGYFDAQGRLHLT